MEIPKEFLERKGWTSGDVRTGVLHNAVQELLAEYSSQAIQEQKEKLHNMEYLNND